jgi:DNA-binding NtrC family response regulator
MNAAPEKDISVVIVDDDPAIRKTTARHLREKGYNVRVYANGKECLKSFKEQPADIVITDLRMPEMDGLTLLRAIKEHQPSTEVIVITAYGDKDSAIAALRGDAYDFFEKPVRLDELSETIRRTARYQAVSRERDLLAQQVLLMSKKESERWGIEGFVGKSKAVENILKQIRTLQQYSNTSVLITGESGTGKELIARAIHSGSARSGKPFIPVNCSAIPGELVESAFFGHVRGAFTGATTEKKGYFELADGGTLFLDEIGETPLEMQAKLLRILEDGIVTPVGATHGRRTDVRILAAANVDLQTKIAERTFRQDLYFRLVRFTIVATPLREHKEDIPLLVEHFLNLFAAEMGKREPAISAEALAALEKYAFPGNVRELKNIIERALIESGGAPIQPRHLHFAHIDVSPITSNTEANSDSVYDIPLKKARDAFEKRYLIRALQGRPNLTEAAQQIGVHRTTLYDLLRKHGIDPSIRG